MNKNEKKIITIVDPIYFKAINDKLKNTSSKNKYTLTNEDFIKFNQIKISKKEINTIITKFEKQNQKIFPNTNNLKREHLFKLLDETSIKYSPRELDKFGLSQSFTGSLIYTFLKYDFEQKYGNPEILKKLVFDENNVTKKEAEFLIEKGHLILDQIKHENLMYFIFIFLNKLEIVMDIYLEDIDSQKQKSLILIFKYIKIIKKVITNHIDILKNDNKSITEIIILFKKFEEDIKKGINDKDLLLKIRNIFKFEIGYESPEGGKFYLKKN